MENKNNRKRIGILMGQPQEDNQSKFITGFFRTAFSYNWDVCVFAMYQKSQENEAREQGESNIYNVVNYDSFDAIVLMSDTILTPGVASKVEKEIKERFKGKVLLVDKDSKRFPSIKMDHYTPMVRLISHLIEEHGYKDIAFLTGKQWHVHSKQRLQAFLDCMESHKIPVAENRVFYGDYWYDSGEIVVEKLISEGGKLPEAIACANDYMAIGAADALTKKGIRVPDDVAVIGYDSTDEGRHSPEPVTSMPLPAEEFGEYAAVCVKCLFEDKELLPFKPKYRMFMGHSCGCNNTSLIPELPVRDTWATALSTGSVYASFNHLFEDMVARTDFKGLIDTVQTYTYQIREFEGFHLCLNDNWISEENPASVNIITNGYAENMLDVLSCGPSGKGADVVNFEHTFKTEEMLPELYEEADTPRGYIFTPIYFENSCFGYAALSYGNEPKSYNETYYMWLRYVMMGLECYRRIDAIRRSRSSVNEGKIIDDMTGLYNYKGFVKHSKPMYERAKLIRNYITIMAVDVTGLDGINVNHGREEGDQVITAVGHMLVEAAGEGGLCCRLGNDEFIVAQLTEEISSKLIHGIRRRLNVLIDKYNTSAGKPYKINIASGSSTARVNNMNEMEHLVNAAVSRKNGNKTKEMRMHNMSKLTDEEMKQTDIVKRLLDENRFSYHFQPIVDAHTGDIFAYEALMRADVTPYISPLLILKYAEHLGRMDEIEKATFMNVLKFVEEHEDEFDGKKIFINSIPGLKLPHDDVKAICDRLKNFSGQVVVEMTEQSEAEDAELDHKKHVYQELGVQVAVDDYGTGYSNIVNLLRYMPDYVKIDRMLLSGIQNNPQKQHFVKEIVEFAHDNDFLVLAEGVETVEELQTVITLGSDLIQGYYTERPNPVVMQEIDKKIKEEIIEAYNHK